MKLSLALSAQKTSQKPGQVHVQLSVHSTLFAEDESHPEASDRLFLFSMYKN